MRKAMGSHEVLLAAMHRDLHDLCQPLTVLMFQLELGRMRGDAESLQQAVEGALGEVERLCLSVAQMRGSLQEADEMQREQLQLKAA
jgi:hypothetical protein